MSTQALTVKEEYAVNPEVARFQLEQRMARLFVASGLFSDIKGQTEEQAIAQAWVKIGLGASMGFSPAESMQGIDLIQGRPAVGAQLRAARMQRNGYDWTIEQCDAEGCRITVYRADKKLGEVSFLKADAVQAGLFTKDNWKKDPASMFFARAITRAQRRFAPGVLSLDVMSTEEAIDIPPPIQMATENKTQALGERLKAARTKPTEMAPEDLPPSTPPTLADVKVTAVASQAVRAVRADMPTPATAVSEDSDHDMGRGEPVKRPPHFTGNWPTKLQLSGNTEIVWNNSPYFIDSDGVWKKRPDDPMADYWATTPSASIRPAGPKADKEKTEDLF